MIRTHGIWVCVSKGGDPLNEPVMAAIYGYKFNGELWRLNDQGYPEPLLEPMLGRWEQLHYHEGENSKWLPPACALISRSNRLVAGEPLLPR